LKIGPSRDDRRRHPFVEPADVDREMAMIAATTESLRGEAQADEKGAFNFQQDASLLGPFLTTIATDTSIRVFSLTYNVCNIFIMIETRSQHL
jgi:cobyric acid synthase